MKYKTKSLLVLSVLSALMIGGCKEVPRPSIQLPGGGEAEPDVICVPTIGEDDPFGGSGPPVSVTCGGGARIEYPLGASLGQSLGTFSASQGAVDVSQSNVGIPQQHAIQVKLRNSAGGIIASASFAAVKTGNLIKATNPSAVDAWLLASGANASVIDVSLSPFPVQPVVGENRYIYQVKLSGVTQGAAGELWTNTCSDPDDPLQTEVTACLD